MPHGTSLRMGRLGYQSEAQASLAVSYNGLEGYGASLQDALTRAWAPYQRIGVRGPDGEYRQLSTSLLQIENEFYGTIRPKRTIRSGERPLHALRERGVEYVEVRCMDLDPFEPVGIGAQTARFLDVFLLHCLLSDSPPDTPEEIAALGRNQHRAAARGREPGLTLERRGAEVLLVDWAAEVLEACAPIARRLDQVDGDSQAHQRALADAQARLADPAGLPSARVLQAMSRTAWRPVHRLRAGLFRAVPAVAAGAGAVCNGRAALGRCGGAVAGRAAAHRRRRDPELRGLPGSITWRRSAWPESPFWAGFMAFVHGRQPARRSTLRLG